MGKPAAIERSIDGVQQVLWLGNVQIVLARRAPSLTAMRSLVREMSNLAAVFPDGMGVLLVIRGDVAPPDEPARVYIREELQRAPMAACAQVVEATGFKGAAMRSMLSLLQLMLRPAFPMKIFSDLQSASRWLVAELRKRCGATPEAENLESTVQKARDRFFQTPSLTP